MQNKLKIKGFDADIKTIPNIVCRLLSNSSIKVRLRSDRSDSTIAFMCEVDILKLDLLEFSTKWENESFT